MAGPAYLYSVVELVALRRVAPRSVALRFQDTATSPCSFRPLNAGGFVEARRYVFSAPVSSPSPPAEGGESWGENSPKPIARLEPLNHPLTRPSGTLSPTGGEGWDEGAVHGEEGRLAHRCVGVSAACRPSPPPSPRSFLTGRGGAVCELSTYARRTPPLNTFEQACRVQPGVGSPRVASVLTRSEAVFG